MERREAVGRKKWGMCQLTPRKLSWLSASVKKDMSQRMRIFIFSWSPSFLWTQHEQLGSQCAARQLMYHARLQGWCKIEKIINNFKKPKKQKQSKSFKPKFKNIHSALCLTDPIRSPECLIIFPFHVCSLRYHSFCSSTRRYEISVFTDFLENGSRALKFA